MIFTIRVKYESHGPGASQMIKQMAVRRKNADEYGGVSSARLQKQMLNFNC